jgi:Ras-related protein Rab-1A
MSIILKVCVTGDWGVGKSSLVVRFVDDTFTADHQPTIGVEFKNKTVTVDGKSAKLKICDTAGQERFKTITASYYRSADAVLLVYDISDHESLANLEHWMEEVTNMSKPEDGTTNPEQTSNILRFIVANKIDLIEESTKERLEANIEAGKQLAAKEGFQFFTTSAKDSTNVEELFSKLASDVIKQKEQQTTASNGPSYNTNSLSPRKGRVKLDKSDSKTKAKKCMI